MQHALGQRSHDALAGVRVSILGTGGIVSVEQALWRAGARVQRVPSDVDAGPADCDVVLVYLGTSTDARRLGPSSALPARTTSPIFALVDDAGAAIPEEVADFAVAPFRAEEVIARLARLIARQTRQQLRAGNLVLDLQSRAVHIEGEAIETTYGEFEALRSLLVADGRVLSRTEIAQEMGISGGGRAVDVHLHRLRAKCRALRHARIDTVRGVGYRLTRE